jgi:DNA-binding response OmpR family regulator
MLGPTFPLTVVVVDGHASRRLRLAADLGERGLGVSTAATGLAGVEQALEEACNVLVVAEPLPDMETRQFVAMIRAVGPIPIIAIATGSRGVVPALDAGADDAVIDPVESAEIEARIRSVMRRSRPQPDETVELLSIGGLEIDRGAREARVEGHEVALSRKEFDLLVALARQPNRVVSKRELLAEVWHQPYGGADKTVDVHLSWLRRKLGESASEPRYLRTVRGVGIKLVDPEG